MSEYERLCPKQRGFISHVLECEKIPDNTIKAVDSFKWINYLLIVNEECIKNYYQDSNKG